MRRVRWRVWAQVRERVWEQVFPQLYSSPFVPEIINEEITSQVAEQVDQVYGPIAEELLRDVDYYELEQSMNEERLKDVASYGRLSELFES